MPYAPAAPTDRAPGVPHGCPAAKRLRSMPTYRTQGKRSLNFLSAGDYPSGTAPAGEHPRRVSGRVRVHHPCE